ncbi:hypothetical protein [Kitasatospora phosalacinea]|uniref:hypothetical protein n=1 Tax=Kitasatospora phosalacinea TaxID=2065 RepID=UPI000524EFAF|nr:hypothetical protein [Kitasatospora phosalacinea]
MDPTPRELVATVHVLPLEYLYRDASGFHGLVRNVKHLRNEELLTAVRAWTEHRTAPTGP